MGGTQEQVSLLLETLTDRGWSVGEMRREGELAQADVAFDGVEGRLSILYDPWQPYFYRLDLGDEPASIEHCAVWEYYEDNNRYNTLQAAVGAGWVSVGLNDPSGPRLHRTSATVARVLPEHAEHLHNAPSEAHRVAYLRSRSNEVRSATTARVLRVVGAVLAVLTLAALVAVLSNDGDDTAQRLGSAGAVALFLGLPAAITLAIGLRGTKKPKLALATFEALDRFVQSTELAPLRREAPREVAQLGVVEPSSNGKFKKVPLIRARLSTRGKGNAQPSLEITSYRVGWPVERPTSGCVVPERWTTLALVGPEQEGQGTDRVFLSFLGAAEKDAVAALSAQLGRYDSTRHPFR